MTSLLTRLTAWLRPPTWPLHEWRLLTPLAVLRPCLSDTDVHRIVRELVESGADVADPTERRVSVGVAIVELTDDMPLLEDIDRVVEALRPSDA